MVKVEPILGAIVASEAGDLVALEQLLVEEPECIHQVKKEDGMSCLHIAADTANLEIMSTLLGAKMDVNCVDTENECPLHYAAQADEATGLVVALLEAGADIEALNDDRQTPLHVAAANGAAANCAVLLQHGADPNVQDQGGYTPLHCAELSHHDEVAAVLKRSGGEADVAVFKVGATFTYYPNGMGPYGPEPPKREGKGKDAFGKDL